MKDMRLLSFLLALLSTAHSIPASCDPRIRFPYVFGLEDVKETPSYNTSVLNMIGVPDPVEGGVIAAVWSQSKMYFYGGTDHGDAGGYHGVVWMKEDDHAFRFKTAFTKNQEALANLVPVILALDPNEDHIAVVYADTQNIYLSTAGKIRFAFRLLSAATGAIEKSMALEPTHLNDKQISLMRNTMSYYKGDYLYFMISTFDSTFRMIFFRIDLSLPSGTNHFYRSYSTSSERIRVMKYISWPDASTPTIDYLIAGGCGYVTSGSHQACADKFFFINCSPSPTYLASDHPIVSAYQDTEPLANYLGSINTFEIVGLITRTRGDTGHIQYIVQPQCDADYGVFSTICNPTQSPGSSVIRHSTIDFNAANPHTTLSVSSGYKLLDVSTVEFEFVDGYFFGDPPHYADIDSDWLLLNRFNNHFGISHVRKHSTSAVMIRQRNTIYLNFRSTWREYLEPNLNLNLGYISKRMETANPDVIHLFLSMNSQVESGDTEFKVIPGALFSANSLITSAPQGIVLALKDSSSNDITCIDTSIPSFPLTSFTTGYILSSSRFSTWIGEMSLISSGGGTEITGAHSFMITTSATSLWEAESSADQFSIQVAERAVSFTKTADDSSFCQFVDTFYMGDPTTNAASRTFKRSSHLVAFTDGTLHDFTTMVTSTNNLAYLHLPPLECTSNWDPFEDINCGNPLVFYQRTSLGGLSNYYYPTSDPLVSTTTLFTRSFLDKIEPRAPHTQVLGFHLAELSHSYASPLNYVSFPTAYQTMKLGFEITMNTWDGECIAPSDFQPIINSAADEFASFDQIPLFFVSEQVQIKPMTLIPIHQYPFSCLVSDFQVFIKKADGSWVELYDSISGQPTHSNPQDQKMSAMMGFSKAHSTPVDPAHNNLAWLVNQLKVDVSFQAMVEPSGAYAGLSVTDFKVLFTEPADKYINDSPPWNSTNQQFFRMAQLKARPYIGSTLIATEEVFNLYFIFCGEDLTVSDENLADVKSTSYLAPNKIVFDSRYDKYILKVDLTSSTSESYSFSSHQFCTQAQCGASNDVCQDPTKHPFTHTYQVKQRTGGSYSSAPAPITLASAFGASTNSHVLQVDQDSAYSLESFGPFEDMVIQLANGMRGGAGIDTFQFDIWLCTQEWISTSPLVVRYDGTFSMFIGKLSTFIKISGVPALVATASFTKFLPIDTGYSTISASLEKTSTNLTPPHFTLTVETSDSQFSGESVDLAFDFITCFGQNLTIQIPVSFYNSFEAHTAYLGQKAFYGLGEYSKDFSIHHSIETTNIDSVNSTCSSFLRSLPISIRRTTINEIIELSLKVDLANAPISCEGATMSVLIDLEVDSSSLLPVIRQLSLKCPFENALCISPDLSSIPSEDDGDPTADEVLEASGEDGANSTSEAAVVEPPQELEEGSLSLIIGGQVFVYEAVEDDPKLEPPSYTLERVDQDGKSALKFDQPMMRPLDLAKIDYSEVFRFEVVSVLDGSAYQGQWIPSVTTTNGTRKLASDEVASNELAFSWQVTCWETYSICFQFNFSTPANVSSTAFGRDTLKGTVLDTSYFLSASTHLSVDAEEVEPIGGPISAQGLSPTLAENIEQLVAVVSAVGNTAGASNLLIFYLLGASKQKLWSLMNAMQTIIYSTMADVNLPAHAAFFFQQVFEFAKMDVFSTEEVFADIGLRETEPLSPQFEEAGFETKSFLINQGSFLVFLVLGVLEYFSRLLLVWICVRFSRFKVCRKIGIRADDPTFWASLFRLVMQTYIDIFICVALQAISVYEAGWAAHFGTPQESINTVLALSTSLVIIIFPVYSFLWLRTHLENLSEEDKLSNYWPLYENVRLQSLGSALYHILFIARRICLVSLLIFSSGVNVFQAIGFLTLSAANLAYLIGWKPFFNPDQNRQEIINETAVYLASLTMFALLNSATPLAFRSHMGWLLVGICVLSILYNLVFVILDFIWIIKGKAKKYSAFFASSRQNKAIADNYRNSIQIIQDQDEKMRLETILKNLEQQLLHEKWAKERDWCRRHRIDISSWPIEQEYIRRGKAINFFARLQKEKRAEAERTITLKTSKRFASMAAEIKAQVQKKFGFQNRFNRLLQWLFDVEAQGRITEALEQEGRDLGAYKLRCQYSIDDETGDISFKAKAFAHTAELKTNEKLTEQEVNYLICLERLRLLRESDPTDGFMSLLRGSGGKDAMNEILEIIHQVFANGFNIHAHTQPTIFNIYDFSTEERKDEEYPGAHRNLQRCLTQQHKNYQFKKASGDSSSSPKTGPPTLISQITLPFDQDQQEVFTGDSFRQAPRGTLHSELRLSRSSIQNNLWSATPKTKQKKKQKRKKAFK